MQELVDRYTNPYNVKDPAHNAKLTPWEHIKVRRQYSAHAKQKT
jgi:hypothetical protein